ncbi:MAG TPA: PEP-CTERM sorting domain-containing protein [Telluria sp.]|nr:PEP-CTERM sorting domain-containing protein [Telluria sp.]
MSNSNVIFSVIDLTPGDSSTAGFRIIPSTYNMFTDVVAADQIFHFDGVAAAPGMPASVQVNEGDSMARSSTSGTFGELDTHAFVSAYPSGIHANASASQDGVVELYPHSELIIRGQLIQTVEWNPEPLAFDFNSTGFINIGIRSGAQFTGITRTLSLFGIDEASSTRQEEDYMLTFANHSDETVLLTFDAYLTSGVQILAVPEPAMFPMLGAGVLVVAGWRRRARRQEAV